MARPIDPDDDFASRRETRLSSRISEQIKKAGRYQVREELGHGGMSIVYRVDDDVFRRELALKKMRPELSLDGAILNRFIREGILTGQLQHPVIPTIYSLGLNEDIGWHYLMKRIRGSTLEAILRERQADRKSVV